MVAGDRPQSRSELSYPVQRSLPARIGPVPCPKWALCLAYDPVNEINRINQQCCMMTSKKPQLHKQLGHKVKTENANLNIGCKVLKWQECNTKT